MDWNNDGRIGGDDLFLTDVILEDEEDEKNGGGGNKPNGSCLTSLFILLMPAFCYLLSFILGSYKIVKDNSSYKRNHWEN